MPPRNCICLTSCILGLVLSAPASAQAPLHRRIDDAIRAQYKGPLARPATDAEFHRRLSLDLSGLIPATNEVRAFLADKAPDRRTKLIDRLLAGPDFPRRMQEFFHVMFEERRDTKDVPQAAWEDYLLQSFAARKAWNQLVREILTADPEDAKLRASARFYMDRGSDAHLVTKDVGRLFLGRDIECSRCHDHPTVKDYTQADYYGLFAFLHRSVIVRKGKDVVLGERFQPGKVDFESVFFMEKMKTGPRLPGGMEVIEPTFAKGEEFVVPPNPKAGQPGVPKFRPRVVLAEKLTEAARTSPFVRNSANRLWFLMMGRGVVHPLDMHHRGNAPFHPKLLDVLSEGLIELKFDVPAFLREIALSEAYQRSSLLPDTKQEIPEGSFAVTELRPLSPEQLLYSVARATGAWEQMYADAAKEAKADAVRQRDPQWRAGVVRARFGSHVKALLAAFASRAGEPETDFQPTLAGALYLSNEKLVLGWLHPQGDNLLARLEKQTEAPAIADELYLSVLSRLPTAPERTEVAEHLSRRAGQRTLALRELAWALLASTEFRLNH